MSATPVPTPAPAPEDPDDERRRYNFGSAVYGLIIVSALLAAESAKAETYAETVLGAVLALGISWWAHAYSEFVFWRAEAGERLTRGGVGRMLRRELPILVGAIPPLLAVLLAWAAGAGLGTAITIALWTAAAAILATEVITGLQADLSRRELAIQTLLGSALGLLILGLKLVLH
ncbi:MAG TPA: hypothetical protein VEF89_31365 [Solirubrobacteraceae bacterium]|nr:hypothetical protein [Solirubrobacteraceae bacterium]